ncbi:MAG TPA: DUF1801 domain-containing protein [Thermoanaerobaculia bacterium]|nr:DUF1801 domain-containing protein [Thermoanaerobaculia bacterium]
MAELKTKATDVSVEDFLARIEDESVRADCQKLVRMMKKITRAEPKLWGTSIVGFGVYRYQYASGRSGEWLRVGFAPRKRDLTLYIMPGFDKYGDLMARLGKHKTGKSCLYLKRLADVDTKVLEELVRESVAHMKATYG